MAKNAPELARLGALHKTIPKSRATVAVTASSAQASLSAYAGKWIWLQAVTADITVLLGTQTLTAGNGWVLKTTADPMDFFVDPGDDLTLAHISSGSATLVILYD